jgi:hypothetical protein
MQNSSSSNNRASFFACLAFIVELAGVLLLIFSGYAIYKCEDSGGSSLSILAFVFGAAAISSFALQDVSNVFCSLNVKRIAIAFDLLIITALLSIFTTSHLSADGFSEFLISELGILRRIKGKARVFHLIVVTIERQLGCCRIHNLVRTKSTDFN